MADAFEAIENAFGQFFAEKLRPEVERINLKRKSLLKWSLLAAGGVFCLFFLVAYYFLAPYFKMFGEHNLTYWPILLLLPAAMATVSFSLIYIILLRSLVAEFRDILVKRTAEFIDPVMAHKAGHSVTAAQLRHSLLFESLTNPRTGRDSFAGRRGGFAFEFCDFRAGSAAKKGKTDVGGIYFSARFERQFPALLVILASSAPASLSRMAEAMADLGIPRGDELVRLEVPGYDLQLVTRSHDQEEARRVLATIFTPELLVFCHRRGLDPHLSCVGGRLGVALLGKRNGPASADIFDFFDYEICREFCLQAIMCLKVAEGVDRMPDDFWTEPAERQAPPPVPPAQETPPADILSDKLPGELN